MLRWTTLLANRPLACHQQLVAGGHLHLLAEVSVIPQLVVHKHVTHSDDIIQRHITRAVVKQVQVCLRAGKGGSRQGDGAIGTSLGLCKAMLGMRGAFRESCQPGKTTAGRTGTVRMAQSCHCIALCNALRTPAPWFPAEATNSTPACCAARTAYSASKHACMHDTTRIM
jgi:hypothetical protein